MTLTTQDKIALGIYTVVNICCLALGNSLGVLTNQSAMISYMLYRIYLNQESIKVEVSLQTQSQEKLNTVFVPQEDTPTEQRKCNIKSVPKVLSTIYVNDKTTLLDYIAEVSTTETSALNLMKAHDAILEAVTTLKLNEKIV